MTVSCPQPFNFFQSLQCAFGGCVLFVCVFGGMCLLIFSMSSIKASRCLEGSKTSKPKRPRFFFDEMTLVTVEEILSHRIHVWYLLPLYWVDFYSPKNHGYHGISSHW